MQRRSACPFLSRYGRPEPAPHHQHGRHTQCHRLWKRPVPSFHPGFESTDYGKDLCLRFIRDLKESLPDAIIVSGLAYGIDIHAHRAALQCGLDTIGVLAHGLDRIYPFVHRNTASEMISHGGLLTEFMSGTNPDRQNFVNASLQG